MRDTMVHREVQAFIGACAGERDARLATCADGMRALAVCDAARRASEADRAMTVEYQ
jgi:predicted dehydrogenase